MVQERIEDLLSIKQGYLVIFFLIVIDLVSKFVAEENLVFGKAIPLNTNFRFIACIQFGHSF
jgi:hypothetical protein